MILLINTSKEKLHFHEFVKPIGDILIKNNTEGFIRKYDCITKTDLKKASKIIICGTSLKDDEYLKNVKFFEWMKNFNKPILGICAGMQIIQLVFNEDKKPFIKKQTEIGFFKEDFKKDFLGLDGAHEVYHLHNNYIELSSFFVESTNSIIPQAIKHKSKSIYGVLFHPEVRNKVLIKNFINL